MKKVLFTGLFTLFLAGPALAQVCLTTDTGAKACIEVPVETPTCRTGYPAVTLVAQGEPGVSSTLAGTPVCVLRVVPGSKIPGDPFIAVLGKRAYQTPEGSDRVETQEMVYYSSQLSGATKSSAISVAQ